MIFYAAFRVGGIVYAGPVEHVGRTWRIEGYRRKVMEPFLDLDGPIGQRSSMELLKLLGEWEKGEFYIPDTNKPLFCLDPIQYLEIAHTVCDREGAVVML
ncbi:MAG: hypothetical protein HYT72_04190 [Candidatus Aenigmarchaeota archaeon]|nr:hypothetical protein [Candidatus Aenigmarchaeota archaeon]